MITQKRSFPHWGSHICTITALLIVKFVTIFLSRLVAAGLSALRLAGLANLLEWRTTKRQWELAFFSLQHRLAQITTNSAALKVAGVVPAE